MEILALRHQLAVLQRKVGKPAFTPDDRTLLAALLHHLPTQKLRQLHLLMRPDTILRWHRELLNQRHAATCAPRRRGRQRTVTLHPRPGPAPRPREPLAGYRRIQFTAAFNAVLHDAGLRVVLAGIRMPRMNSIMER